MIKNAAMNPPIYLVVRFRFGLLCLGDAMGGFVILGRLVRELLFRGKTTR
jgi:hypothetical protein